ncbi:ANR family transcriptional regulator [Yersinia intermedia]|uniref:ANR family transcriptional regulator n=2 Tax=Yersinia intermedia TaxID=631 RepID=UPI002242ED9D|nr:ANR family transcriptional regulator [Yersinia intermedia]MCW8114311.1 ANR family transcriptional regulator [Yersinia intermedia]
MARPAVGVNICGVTRAAVMPFVGDYYGHISDQGRKAAGLSALIHQRGASMASRLLHSGRRESPELAKMAAEQEKKEAWFEAAVLWDRVAQVTTQSDNRDWATCRADFCRRRIKRL